MTSMIDILDEMQLTQSEELEEKDMINSPSHYKLDGLDIESKEVIKAVRKVIVLCL